MIESFEQSLLSRLMALDSTQRAHAYVQANCWKWPDALAELSPEGWERMTQDEKHSHPQGKTLWRVLWAVTTEFERSRQWWREQLKANDEAHLSWWNAHFKGGEML